MIMERSRNGMVSQRQDIERIAAEARSARPCRKPFGATVSTVSSKLARSFLLRLMTKGVIGCHGIRDVAAVATGAAAANVLLDAETF